MACGGSHLAAGLHRVVYRGTGEAEERLALGGHHPHSDDAVTLRDLLVRSHAVGNDGGVAGHAWRASTVLQTARWLCSQCGIAFCHSVSICPSCNVESATVRFEANESLHARARGVHDAPAPSAPFNVPSVSAREPPSVLEI